MRERAREAAVAGGTRGSSLRHRRAWGVVTGVGAVTTALLAVLAGMQRHPPGQLPPPGLSQMTETIDLVSPPRDGRIASVAPAGSAVRLRFRHPYKGAVWNSAVVFDPHTLTLVDARDTLVGGGRVYGVTCVARPEGLTAHIVAPAEEPPLEIAMVKSVPVIHKALALVLPCLMGPEALPPELTVYEPRLCRAVKTTVNVKRENADEVAVTWVSESGQSLARYRRTDNQWRVIMIQECGLE